MAVFIPLNGPNDRGKKPKAPSLNGWQGLNYKGINPKTFKGWYGLRCDGYIVVDCDSIEAMMAWLEVTGEADLAKHGWVRKTPHGYHFIYKWHDPLGEHEELQGPHAGVLPGIDLRQGRTSQIVYVGGCGRAKCEDPWCHGFYETQHGGPSSVREFYMPEWSGTFDLRSSHYGDEDTWDEMPDGIGNNTMTALAGTMRKQGMSMPKMVQCLAAINRLTMTADPMPSSMLIEIARSVSRYEVDPFLTEIEFEE